MFLVHCSIVLSKSEVYFLYTGCFFLSFTGCLNKEKNLESYINAVNAGELCGQGEII